MTRVALIGSPEKESVPAILERMKAWLAERATVVFAELTYAAELSLLHDPELLFTLGGDGTLIAAVHGLRQRQVPIVGMNLGKLGFLAEFSVDEIEREGDFLFRVGLPITRRLMLDVRLEEHHGGEFATHAVNDCVVLAGPPFRMVELRIEVDGDEVAELRGDGLILSTASGSTAHNLSAGGPILEPTAEAFVITPICPHALTFRPLALDARRRVVVTAVKVNSGTMVSVDGRVYKPLRVGDRVVVTRYAADFLLVRNPRRSAWYSLRRKLMWGENPRNG